MKNKKKLRFIINPVSGTKSKKFVIKIIDRYLNKKKYDYEICYTKYPKHAILLSSDAATLKYDVVAAIGGDGTVNEVGKKLIGSNSILSIIPTGSGNGLARHLNISKNPIKAIQLINNFKYMSIDTIKINEEIFLSVAGIGFDAHIANKFANAKKRGFYNYAKLILKEYFVYKPKIFEMIVDEKKINKKGLLVSFVNSSQYGNNIQIEPKAKIDDGYFRLVILKNPSFLKKIPTLIRLTNGSINKSKYFESIKCKSLIINQKKIVAHIDGESIFFENGIEIKPYKKIKILIP